MAPARHGKVHGTREWQGPYSNCTRCPPGWSARPLRSPRCARTASAGGTGVWEAAWSLVHLSQYMQTNRPPPAGTGSQPIQPGPARRSQPARLSPAPPGPSPHLAHGMLDGQLLGHGTGVDLAGANGERACWVGVLGAGRAAAVQACKHRLRERHARAPACPLPWRGPGTPARGQAAGGGAGESGGSESGPPPEPRALPAATPLCRQPSGPSRHPCRPGPGLHRGAKGEGQGRKGIGGEGRWHGWEVGRGRRHGLRRRWRRGGHDGWGRLVQTRETRLALKFKQESPSQHLRPPTTTPRPPPTCNHGHHAANQRDRHLHKHLGRHEDLRHAVGCARWWGLRAR